MKNLIYFFFLSISFTAFAQTKFIEVEVKDTITLKPQNFKCNIYGRYSDTTTVAVGYGKYDPMANEEAEKKKLKKVKTMLEAKQYKVSEIDPSINNYTDMLFYGGENGLTVLVNNEAEVQKLREMLSNEDVNVHTRALKYTDEKAEEQLIKKLLDKAKSKAALIAYYSDLKLGKIIEVKEVPEFSSSSPSDVYEQALWQKYNNYIGKNYEETLSKTMVIKFAAE